MQVAAGPSDGLIRDYAYHLYVQSGAVPGRDVDNWLEAKACVLANVPIHRSHVRLQSLTAKSRASGAARVISLAGSRRVAA